MGIARELERAGAGPRLAAALAREVEATGLSPRAAGGVRRFVGAASPGLLERLEACDLAPRALAVLCAHSHAYARWLARDPEALLLACAGSTEVDPDVLRAALRAAAGAVPPADLAATRAALAREQRRALLQVAVRDDVLRGSSLDAARDLARVADALIEVAFDRAAAALEARGVGGGTGTRVSVLGLGKLGGRELNYSSDVDLVLLRDDAAGGSQTPARWATRLGKALVEVLAGPAPEAPLYRVDLRLRPDGERGALVPGLRAMLRHYEERGRTWERQALLKARPVAGDLALGQELLTDLQPFVFRRYLSAQAIADIRRIKAQVEAQSAARPGFSVKTGTGGIRDVEFSVQLLQLLHGPEQPALRVPGTVAALRELEAARLLDAEDASLLRAGYAFLRMVEHRLQTLDMRQTQAVPVADEAVRDLALRVGYRGGDEAARFRQDLAHHRRQVRRVFERVFLRPFAGVRTPAERAVTDLVLDPALSADRAAAVLTGYGFGDPVRTRRDLRRLAADKGRFLDRSPRARAALATLAPALLREVSREADPTEALSRFERMARRIGAKPVFYELLREHPDALTLFTRLAGGSPFLHDLLVARPGLMDEVVDRLLTGEPTTRKALRARLGALDALQPATIAEVQRAALLHTGIRDLGQMANVANVQVELTAIAEVCLEGWLHLASREVEARHAAPPGGGSLFVLGLGKLGGRELGYGSDLDVVLTTGGGPREVLHATRIGQRLVGLAEAERLYEIDARLRPGGRNAPLVSTARALERYYAERAEVWELLAGTKLRAVATDQAAQSWGAAAGCLDRVRARIYARRVADLRSETRAMRERLFDARRSDRDLKRGRGGLVEIELLTACLRLASGGEPHAVRAPGVIAALHALSETGAVPTAAYVDLLTGYQLLRKVEGRLRIVHGRPVSELPTQPGELRALAIRLGYQDTPGGPAERSFEAELAYHRGAVQRRFEELLGG